MKRLIVFIAVCLGILAALAIVITFLVVRHIRAEEEVRHRAKCERMLQTVKEFSASWDESTALMEAMSRASFDQAETLRLSDRSTKNMERFNRLFEELQREGFYEKPCPCPEASAWLAASEAERVRALKATSR